MARNFTKSVKDSIDLDLLLDFTKIDSQIEETLIEHDAKDENVETRSGISVAMESLGAVKIDDFETGK